MLLNLKDIVISLDLAAGAIDSVIIRGKERLAKKSQIFSVRLRDAEGKTVTLTSLDARLCTETAGGATYTGFSVADVSVSVSLSDEMGDVACRISVTPMSERYFVECVDVLPMVLPHLVANNVSGDGGKILFPYNEGVLISDADVRDNMWLRHEDASYPSKGCYAVFPNMICSQMLAYIWDDAALYVGAHDAARGVKEIDYIKEDDGVRLLCRIFCGTDFGETFEMGYPLVLSVTDGRWDAAAERYREWFESSLPSGAVKISENGNLPSWYADSPLVVTYPVRGVHDTDEMKPNKLYPYTNALPMLEEIGRITDSRLLVLLMHWEGTAPWAPPHVWPPYGGVDNFTEFMHALHERGDMLGVYCSGFGYTEQSNLIAEYNKADEYEELGYEAGMCVSPYGRVEKSNICLDQRVGYDICPASEVGRSLLKKCYEPLFKSELDYVQILDQNHGGGQYFCYGRNHGHAPAPGPWMTENMQNMLTEWNGCAGKTLFGCESAAAEPFIGNLLFSDNRFELNFMLGEPVPMYAYIYHEYVRNFMGNQVCCPFSIQEDTLRYRLAYSFVAGDSMTLIVTQDAGLASHWGVRDFTYAPDREKALRLIANLTKLYKDSARPYLCSGRMIPAPEVKCDGVSFEMPQFGKYTFPSVFSSAWQAEDGGRALILVNPGDRDAVCEVNGESITVPALDGVMLPINI